MSVNHGLEGLPYVYIGSEHFPTRYDEDGNVLPFQRGEHYIVSPNRRDDYDKWRWLICQSFSESSGTTKGEITDSARTAVIVASALNAQRGIVAVRPSELGEKIARLREMERDRQRAIDIHKENLMDRSDRIQALQLEIEKDRQQNDRERKANRAQALEEGSSL